MPDYEKLSTETHGGSLIMNETKAPGETQGTDKEAGYLPVVGVVPEPKLFTGNLEDLFLDPQFTDERSAPARMYRDGEPRPDMSTNHKYDPTKPAGPYNSPWRDTTTTPEITHRHKFVAHLGALGLTQIEISRRSGYSVDWLSRIFSHPEFQKEIDTLRKELFGNSLDQQLKLSLPSAVKVIHQVLNDENEKSALRVDAAFRLMDRTHGKPNQRVEHTGSLLKDLFAELDARDETEENKPIDIEAEWSDPQKTDASSDADAKDDVSAFLKETYEKDE